MQYVTIIPMLTFEQMLIRLLVALVLGAILGVERELVGKEAGVRTEMLVAGGAAIFSISDYHSLISPLAYPIPSSTSPRSRTLSA